MPRDLRREYDGGTHVPPSYVFKMRAAGGRSTDARVRDYR
jgi:hypothetical protein